MIGETKMKTKLCLTAALLALLASALLAGLHTRTEITGTDAAVQLSTTGTAVWVQIIAGSGNASPVRVGDSTVTATSGVRLVPGSGQMLPPLGGAYSATYSLNAIYVYVANGDKVSVLWGD
jgi:hypothetical protein